MQGKVIKGKILLEPIEEPGQTKGGILIYTERKKQGRGKIVILGEAPDDASVNLNVGDIVYYNLFVSSKTEIEGKEHHLLDYHNILYIC